MISKNRLFLLITLIIIFILSGCTNTTKIEVSKKLSDFDNCRPDSDGQFHDGLLWGTCSNEYTVYYDYDGNLAFSLPSNIQPQSDFYEKRAVVLDTKTNLYGYIDTNGDIVIPCKYNRALEFSEGVAYIETDEYPYGALIDKKGAVSTVLSNEYTFDYGFCHGLAVVYSRKDGKLGCINKNGEIVTPCKYDYIRGLEEGLSLIENQKGEYGYINRDGKIAIELKYKNARDFHEGLGAVENNKGKWGYIDKRGNVVIPFEYEDARYFSKGMAAVKNDKGKWGYIDKKGNVVIAFQYEDARDFSEGLAAIANEKGQYGFINGSGKLVIDYQNYNKVKFFKDGICLVGIDDDYGGKFGYIDRRGDLITPLEYNILSTSFKDGYAVAVKDEETAFIIKNLSYHK